MAFGLTGAPATFQRMMDTLLMDIKGTEAYVYLDDVIIHSNTFSELCARIERVLNRFRQANLKMRLEKCTFAASEVNYLGHIISAQGVRPDPGKVQAVQEYAMPTSRKEVRAFVGLAGYYRRFIPHYSELVRPLTQLTSERTPFVWEEQCQKAFETVKQMLCSDLVLAYPDFHHPFILATDASGVALGAVLSQEIDGQERPICYASRQLNAAERNYSTTERELLAVVWATKVFRCYLYGRRFTIVTDHRALNWMLSLKDPSSRLTRWALRLAEFNYTVVHREGKKHCNADALSRSPPTHLMAPITDWTDDKVREVQFRDRGCCDTERKFALDTFRDSRGVLFKGKPGYARLVVPREMIPKILVSYHDAPAAGHPGAERTLDLIQRDYYWPGMNDEVKEYVGRCRKCALRKTPYQPKAELGKPAFPNKPFELVSMDIVGPLPQTGLGHRYILTMIDHFSRYAEAVPLKTQAAPEVAKAFVARIVARHGVPDRVLTDQGRNFVSDLIKQMCRTLGVHKIQTTPYHPQSNGAIERFHRTLVDILSHYVHRDGRNWDQWLNLALMAYNNLTHSATGYSPNYLIFGREVTTPFDINPKDQQEVTTNDAVSEYHMELTRKLRIAHEAAQQATRKAHEQNARRYNHRAITREFAPGEWVYLRDPGLSEGHAKKFSRPWTGPYRVIEKLTALNYKLDLPPGKSRVVHVNRLKRSATESPVPEGRPCDQGLLRGSTAPNQPDELSAQWEGTTEEEEEEGEDGNLRMGDESLTSTAHRGSRGSSLGGLEPMSEWEDSPVEPDDPRDETWHPTETEDEDPEDGRPGERSPYLLRPRNQDVLCCCMRGQSW